VTQRIARAAEPAFDAACMLGRRFGLVGFTAALKPMLVDCLEHAGLSARCAGFRMGPAFSGDPGRRAAAALAGMAPIRRAHRTRPLSGCEPGLTTP